MKRIFVTGGEGQLAFELKRLTEEDDCVFPSKKECDITSFPDILNALKTFKPDAVINTAAFTKVDLAEKEISNTFAVNRDGVRNLSQACREIKCPLLHVSTDYVFNGASKKPYGENDTPDPINQYGLSKWEGEKILQETYDQHMILRVSAVFGVQGQNFVKTIARLLKERDQLSIVDDQITCPTPAKHIAETLLRMLKNPVSGLYHYCGDTPVSWFAFASEIARIMKSRVTLKPITTAEYPLPAKRPLYSVLDCTKLEKTFGITKPNWKTALEKMIQDSFEQS
jgi:dTDP-4-dehydrorhamnose reductase